MTSAGPEMIRDFCPLPLMEQSGQFLFLSYMCVSRCCSCFCAAEEGVCLILLLLVPDRGQGVERGEAPGNGPEGAPSPLLCVLRSVPPGGPEPGADGRLRRSAAGLESRCRRRERPAAAGV